MWFAIVAVVVIFHCLSSFVLDVLCSSSMVLFLWVFSLK